MYFIGIFILITGAVIVFLKATTNNVRWLIISCLSVLYINFYLNFTLYPRMSALKGENQAADYVNQFYPGSRLGVFQNRRNGFEFYAHQTVQQVDVDKWIAGYERDRIYYVDDVNYPELVSKKAQFKVLKQFVDRNSENIIKYIRSPKNEPSVHHGYLIHSE